MTEHCQDDAHYYYHGDTSQLDSFFSNPDIAPSLPEFRDRARRSGVHAMNVPGGNTLVRITGVCPNKKNGVCTLGPKCFSAFVEQNPPQVPQDPPVETEKERIKRLLRAALEADGE
jgi:hypothetical protein